MMRTMYILDEKEIIKAKDRLKELKHIALLSRDAGQMEDNREYYLRAKGFEDALRILGIITKEEEEHDIIRTAERTGRSRKGYVKRHEA